MRGFKFSALRQPAAWISPAFVAVDDKGLITSIGEIPVDGISYEDVKGYAIPGFYNAHSHAFQYAMAGLAEVHPKGSTASDFWSWRNKMYEIALTVDPDDMRHIAAMLYAEMVRHGYSHVVEFHYLHHDKDGKPYGNIGEMGSSLVEAAALAGINITLVPMLYQQGGFNKPPESHQRRFISTTEQYLELLSAYKKMLGQNSHMHLGYGAHSIRAAAKGNIEAIINELGDKLPFHIHIAEQLKEVEEAKQYLGTRPVQWLLENFPVNENFHLVHATHLLQDEIEKIARAGANVVLCPSTEGNLGDGIFPFHPYQALNGQWSIGTDSHIGLNPLEELRILDYGQRLVTHKRNTFAPEGGDGAGNALQQVFANGRKAAGLESMKEYFETGQPLNAVVIENSHPLLEGAPGYRLSTIFYHFDSSNSLGTIINGNWIVENGVHHGHDRISSAFVNTLRKLGIRKG